MDNIIKGIEWRREMIPFESEKAGKILHFQINEFAVGFGPAIFKKRSKKTGEIFFRPLRIYYDTVVIVSYFVLVI